MTSTRDFSTFEKWNQYAVAHGYCGLKRGEVKKKDQSFYMTGYTKKWLDGLFAPAMDRHFKTYEEYEAHAIEQGYTKLNFNDLCSRDWPFCKTGYNRRIDGSTWISLLQQSLPKQTEKRPQVRFVDWLADCRRKGYHLLTRSQFFERATDAKERAYVELGKNYKKRYPGCKKWIDVIIPEKSIREWETLRDWIEHGHRNAYDQLRRSELQRKDPGYYHKGMRERDSQNRRWIDHLIEMRVRTKRDLAEMLSREDVAAIASLANHACVQDIADLLTTLWPKAFPSAADLARSLPKAVQGIGHALQPFDFAAAEKIMRQFPSGYKRVEHRLNDILHTILFEKYQTSFNKNPKRTVRELAKYLLHPQLGSIATRLHGTFTEIMRFDIPGQGSLEDRLTC